MSSGGLYTGRPRIPASVRTVSSLQQGSTDAIFLAKQASYFIQLQP